MQSKAEGRCSLPLVGISDLLSAGCVLDLENSVYVKGSGRVMLALWTAMVMVVVTMMKGVLLTVVRWRSGRHLD